MSKQGSKGGAAPGKAKKPAKPGADEKREDVLQAVILVDSFQDRFKPFTLETPRVRRILSQAPSPDRPRAPMADPEIPSVCFPWSMSQ